jgi:hypothetical protein
MLVAVAIAVGWYHGRTRSSRALARAGKPAVVAVAWRPVGTDVEPWSGLGLGNQVEYALGTLGVVVAHDTGLRVPPLPGGPEALADLGRQLNATYVLGGTVGRKGPRREIGMQLVRVKDGATLWTSTFWRDAADLESLASDLALTVAQVLETEVDHHHQRPAR